MTRVAKTLLALVLVLALPACDSRTEKADGGGVLLSIEDFDGLPIIVSVNTTGLLVQIEELTISNIAKDPAGTTSTLMNVEIHSYEVTFTRGDRGTRIPTPYIRGIFGVAPVNGTYLLENAPIMSLDQLDRIPLSDLRFENGAVDTETGESRIILNCRLRFFGRTLSGDEVETAPAAFTIEFIP